MATAIGGLLCCEQCSSPYYVLGEEGAKKHLRCNKCGHAEDVIGATAGKWTLVDPKGRMRAFESAAALAKAMAEDESKPKPASAMLDATPLPTAPSSGPVSAPASRPPPSSPPGPTPLEMSESEREISVRAKSEPKIIVVPEHKRIIPEPVPDSEPPESLPAIALVPSLKAEDAMDDNSDDDEMPISLRDVAEEDEEPVSLRDVVAETETPHMPRVSNPPPLPSRRPPEVKIDVHPPKAGALKTLPASSALSLPPSITIEDKPKSVRPKASATKTDPPKASAKKKSSAKSDRKKIDDPPITLRKPSAAAPAQAQPDGGGRRWTIPALLLIVAVGVWWVAMRNPAPEDITVTPTPTGSTPTAVTSGAPTTSAATTTTPTDTTPPTPTAPATTSTSTSTTVSTANPNPTTTGPLTPPPPSTFSAAPSSSVAPTGPISAAGVDSVAVALARAAAARGKGDLANAKELYERALALNAGNAEALTGLGHIARASGDTGGAKSMYEKALGTSPGYTPALLSLADTEWDSGDRTSAQRHYAQLLAAAPNSAARVHERAGEAPKPAPAPTTSATEPPPAP